MKQTQKKRKKKQYKKWPWVAAILALLVIAVVVFAGARLAAEKSKVHAFICGKVRSIYSGHRGTIPSAWRMHLMRAAAHMSAKPRPGIFCSIPQTCAKQRMGPSADMTFMARLRAVVRPARNF